MRHLYLQCLILIMSITTMAQDFTGDWKGNLEIPQMGEMEIIFHITQTDDAYSTTMDVPMQGATGLPMKTEVNGKEITLAFSQAQLEFKGTLNGEKIEGTFSQAGQGLPFSLNKFESKLPGNTDLPSTQDELDALKAYDKGNYKYSVADYFAKPKASSFQLSPNGKYMSYKEKDENLKNHVYVKEIATGKVTRVIEEKEELIRGYGWANDERLIYAMDEGGNENYHIFAVNIDGSNQKDLTPYDEVTVNILASLKEDKEHMIISMNKENKEVFNPYKININTGDIEKLYDNTDLENPIMGYDFDKDGNLRGFSRLKDGVNQEYYYTTDGGKNYEILMETKWDDTFSISSFNYASDNPHEAYVVSNLTSDKIEVQLYDLAENQKIKTLFKNDQFDAAGISLSRKRNWEIDYFSYNGEKEELFPQSKFFKKMYKTLQKEFKGYEISITAHDDDENTFLVYVGSDKLYGKYYSYDVKSKKTELLFDLMPQLKEADMAEMRPIQFKSRDGHIIHGYITLPKEALDGKKVPLIVNPHGGPQGVRDYWGFNPESQLFASRGYATLQVNFRISGGYGKEFFRMGFKEIGRKCMDDVEDGLQYVIDQGWVDADKVAIYGASHGGYAVLRGLTKTPDLYACGVDYVGVSNLFTFMETIPPYWKPYLDILKAIWYDPAVPEEKEIMNEVSPVFHIDKIKKPLFVVQGANDPRVNIDEADQIVSGLRAKGVNVPYMVKYDEGHGFGKEENRLDLYEAMMGFFAQNLK